MPSCAHIYLYAVCFFMCLQVANKFDMLVFSSLKVGLMEILNLAVCWPYSLQLVVAELKALFCFPKVKTKLYYFNHVIKESNGRQSKPKS